MNRAGRAAAAAAAVALVASLATGCTVAAGPDDDTALASFVAGLDVTAVPSVEDRPALAAAADEEMLMRLATVATPDAQAAQAVIDGLAAVPVPATLSDQDGDGVHLRRRTSGDAPAPIRESTGATSLQVVKAAGMSLYAEAVPAIAKPQGLTAGVERTAGEGPVSMTYSFDGQHLRGTVSLATSSTDPSVPASLQSQLDIDLQGCPAADGSFTAEIRGSGRLEATTQTDGVGVQSWASESWALALHGRVGDDAYIAEAAIDHRQELTGGQAGGGVRQGMDFAADWGFSYTRGADGDVSMSPDGLPRIARSSSAVSGLDELSLLKAQWMAALVQASVAMDAMEGILRSGLCVELRIEGPAGLPQVAPGSTTTVTARPVLRVDGSAAGGVVTATVTSGKGAVEPATGTAPSTHFYAAPFDNDLTTVRFTSASPAGIGEATQKFAVGGGWSAVGRFDDVLTQGEKCGPVTGEWTLTAAGQGWEYAATATIHFDDDLTGTYSINGTTEISAFSGGGTVWLIPSGENYLMVFDTSDAPIEVTRDASLTGCFYHTD